MEQQLRICAYDEQPWITLKSDGTFIDFLDGFLGDLFKLITNNISFVWIVPVEKFRGNFVNGTWTGCLGVLQNKGADLGLFPQIPSFDSMEIIDFSQPYIYSYTTIISGDQGKFYIDDTFIFKIFHLKVWVGIVISVVVLSITKTAADKLWNKEYPDCSLKDIILRNFFHFYGALFSEGIVMRHRTGSTGLLVSAWIIGVLILQSAYNSSFKADLITITSNTIDNFEELAKHKHVKPFTRSQGFFEAFFATSTDSTVKLLWKRIKDTQSAVSWQLLQSRETWQEVKFGKAALIFDWIPLAKFQVQFCKQDGPVYHYANDPVIWIPLTFALRKGLPGKFVRKLNQMLSIYSGTQQMEPQLRRLRREILPCIWQPEAKNIVQITVEHFLLTFSIYFMGIFLSIVVLILERRL